MMVALVVMGLGLLTKAVMFADVIVVVVVVVGVFLVLFLLLLLLLLSLLSSSSSSSSSSLLFLLLLHLCCCCGGDCCYGCCHCWLFFCVVIVGCFFVCLQVDCCHTVFKWCEFLHSHRSPPSDVFSTSEQRSRHKRHTSKPLTVVAALAAQERGPQALLTSCLSLLIYCNNSVLLTSVCFRY